jgi:hypothetical protein
VELVVRCFAHVAMESTRFYFLVQVKHCIRLPLSLSWELCNLPVVGCEVWHSGRKQQAMQTVEVVYYECEWGLRPLASDRNGRPSASSSHE